MVVGDRSSLARDCCHGHVHLTERELDVLERVAAGCTNDQIGRLLYLSGTAVNRVVAQLLMRTQTKNRAELVARAFIEGVLDPQQWPPRLTGQNIVRLARKRDGDLDLDSLRRRVEPAAERRTDRRLEDSCI